MRNNEKWVLLLITELPDTSNTLNGAEIPPFPSQPFWSVEHTVDHAENLGEIYDAFDCRIGKLLTFKQFWVPILV